MTTHVDLQRDIGRMEAGLEALEKAVSKGFSDAKADFIELKGEIADLKKEVSDLRRAETERKGAWKVIVTVAGGVSAAVAALVKYLTA